MNGGESITSFLNDLLNFGAAPTSHVMSSVQRESASLRRVNACFDRHTRRQIVHGGSFDGFSNGARCHAAMRVI